MKQAATHSHRGPTDHEPVQGSERAAYALPFDDEAQKPHGDEQAHPGEMQRPKVSNLACRHVQGSL